MTALYRRDASGACAIELTNLFTTTTTVTTATNATPAPATTAATTVAAATSPKAGDQECVVCTQVVPECAAGCAVCQDVQQTCTSCSQAVCKDSTNGAGRTGRGAAWLAFLLPPLLLGMGGGA